MTSKFCRDAYECKDEILSNENNPNMSNIYCDGYRSCSETEEISFERIMCGGVESCKYSLNINATNTLYCGGNSGCIKSIINSNYVHCGGDESCKESKIINAKKVSCDGRESCVKSHIYAESVDGFSYHGLKDSIIETSNNSNQLIVKLYGYEAGKKLHIICNETNQCQLDCHGTACYKVSYFCHNKANCNVSPIACKYRKGGSEKGVICPDIHSYSGNKQDIMMSIDNDDDDDDDEENDYDTYYNVESNNKSDSNNHSMIWALFSFAAGCIMTILFNFCLKKAKLKSEYQSIL